MKKFWLEKIVLGLLNGFILSLIGLHFSDWRFWVLLLWISLFVYPFWRDWK